MGRLAIGIGLVLAGALGCGRVEQRTVDEEDATSGGKAQGGRGGSPTVAGAYTGGMGAVASTAATGGVGWVIDPSCGGAPNPLPLQALSNFEYARSVEDVVQITTTEPFPPAMTYGYPFSYGLELYGSNVEALYKLVETYSAVARESLHAPCLEDTVSEECARTIVAPLVQRAFRRAREDDVERYLQLFNTGASDGGWDGGLELVTQGVLLSPAFLFKWYPGEASSDATAQLTSLDLASRLSYFVTGSPPDAELLTAAAADALQSAAGIEQQTRRLLDSPRFPRQAQHFYDQWLDLYQLDNRVGPALSAELLQALRGETESFVADVMKTDRSWITLQLGMQGNLEGGGGPSGLLGSRSTLIRWNNPTQRGMLVRDRFLCQPVPPPPPDVPGVPPEVGPGQTRRDAWLQHRNNPVCSACHMLMDPIGFGLENFDEAGLYRSTDNGLPIDASGELLNAGDAEGPFVGPSELKRRLANSRTVSECQAATWLSFGLQRGADPGDACFAQQAFASFANAEFDIGELIVSIALSRQFRTRDRYAGGQGTALPPMPTLPPTVTGAAARRHAVLDFVIAETRWFASVVSPQDRPIVDQYLDGLRNQQARLGNIQ